MVQSISVSGAVSSPSRELHVHCAALHTFGYKNFTGQVGGCSAVYNQSWPIKTHTGEATTQHSFPCCCCCCNLPICLPRWVRVLVHHIIAHYQHQHLQQLTLQHRTAPPRQLEGLAEELQVHQC